MRHVGAARRRPADGQPLVINESSPASFVMAASGEMAVKWTDVAERAGGKLVFGPEHVLLHWPPGVGVGRAAGSGRGGLRPSPRVVAQVERAGRVALSRMDRPAVTRVASAPP